MASAKTQRIPPAMPASNWQANQMTRLSLSNKPKLVRTGKRPDNHSARKRPKRCVMLATKGVTKKMPIHTVAANSPAIGVDCPSALSCKIQNGPSMK